MWFIEEKKVAENATSRRILKGLKCGFIDEEQQ